MIDKLFRRNFYMMIVVHLVMSALAIAISSLQTKKIIESIRKETSEVVK